MLLSSLLTLKLPHFQLNSSTTPVPHPPQHPNEPQLVNTGLTPRTSENPYITLGKPSLPTSILRGNPILGPVMCLP